MSPSASHSDENVDRPERFVSSPTEGGQPLADARLLEQVLRETLAVTEGAERLEPAYLEALLEVGRRYAGHPLSLEPVAVALVRAVLGTRFGHLTAPAQSGPSPGPSEQLWQAMAKQIAATLLEDPRTRQRLEVFWARLGEAGR